MVDAIDNGRVNFAIIVAPCVDVIGSSKKGDGSLSWITVSSQSGLVNICSLYAPTKKKCKIEFWKWVE